jgi:uncharacterized membrane protein
MAHRDAQVFRVLSEKERRVVCVFCNTICTFKSANRHKSNCPQYKKRVVAVKAAFKKHKKLKRLQVQLSTDTKEVPRKANERRKSFMNVGRFMEESDIAEGNLFGTLKLITSVFTRRLGHVPHLVLNTISFLPIAYVNEWNNPSVIVVNSDDEEL